MDNVSDPLSSLHDIHLPPPVSWWPLAPGWWLVLIAILLVALLAWLYWQWLRNRKPWRAQALHELQRLETELQQGSDASAYVAQLSVLLRRVALSIRNPSTAAALTGEAWLKFLDEVGQTQQFTTGVGRVLTSAPYAPNAQSIDIAALLALARQWVSNAR